MALNNGIAPDTLSGVIGNVVFYSANGNSIVRSRPCNVRKSYTAQAINNKLKFTLANKVGLMFKDWLPYISNLQILKSNRYSKIVSHFMKNQSNTFLYDNIKADGLTIGNGTYTPPTLLDCSQTITGFLNLTWDVLSAPADIPVLTSFIDCFIFTDNLKQFQYYHKISLFSTGLATIELPYTIGPGTSIYCYFLVFNEDSSTFVTSPSSTVTPLSPIILI